MTTSNPVDPEDATRAKVLLVADRAPNAPAISLLAIRQQTNEALSFEQPGHGPLVLTEASDPLAFRPPDGEELLAVVQAPVMFATYEEVTRRFRGTEGQLVTILDSLDATMLITTDRLLVGAFRGSSAETTLLNEETAAIAAQIGLDASLHLNFTAQAFSYRRADIPEVEYFPKDANGDAKLTIGDTKPIVFVSPQSDDTVQLSTDDGQTFNPVAATSLTTQLERWLSGDDSAFT